MIETNDSAIIQNLQKFAENQRKMTYRRNFCRYFRRVSGFVDFQYFTWVLGSS